MLVSASVVQPSLRTTSFGLAWPELNDGLTYRDVVSSDSDVTVIGFYSGKYKSSAPLQGWVKRIQNGQILVDDNIVKDPDFIIRTGSVLIYRRLPWKEPDAPYSLDILLEDDDLIVVNKPSGLQVLPGGIFQQRTVLNQLKWRLESQSTLTENQRSPSVPVHRLGRGTSGILLCAKTKQARILLSSYFADGTSAIADKRRMKIDKTKKLTKIYRALVSGILAGDELVIDHPIGVVQYTGVASGLYVASSSGKPALSKVSVIERNIQENSTLVQVEIQSGRPHQIRIHLSLIGHPLLGDPLYGVGGKPESHKPELSSDESPASDGGYGRPAKPVPGDCGYSLHAHRLILFHPIKNEVVNVVAPLPPYLLAQRETGGAQ